MVCEFVCVPIKRSKIIAVSRQLFGKTLVVVQTLQGALGYSWDQEKEQFHHQSKNCPADSGYTVGCQVPSTKKASPSPGQGGIVAPSALRGSGPSLRN